MRLAVIASLLIAGTACAQTYQYYPQWTRATEIWVPLDNTKRPEVVFSNSYTGKGCEGGQWCRVDLTALGVATDAKAAFLSGLLIITHGTHDESCDLHITTRAPGSLLTEDFYQGQVMEAKAENGQRSGFASWVPLVGGAFEWRWDGSTKGQWPKHCSYGVNLSVQAWVR